MVNYRSFLAFMGFLFTVLIPQSAFATLGVDAVAENMIETTNLLPGLLASIAYLSGLLLGVTGVMKIIEHVTTPTQVPLRTPVIRLLVGGALFALPIITEAAINTIGDSADDFSSYSIGPLAIASSTLGLISSVATLGQNFNTVLETIVLSTTLVEDLILVIGYLLGLLMSVSALYKIRDHVEDPSRVPLKDAVIRLLTAGGLFALPTVYTAMYESILDPGVGIAGYLTDAFYGSLFLRSNYTEGGSGIECIDALAANASVHIGAVMCLALANVSYMVFFLHYLAYIIGLIFGLWALVKIRDHVTNPSQTSLWEGVSRLVAGGLFFALPAVIGMLNNTFGIALNVGTAITDDVTDYSGSIDLSDGVICQGGVNGLDQVMGCALFVTLGPLQTLLNFFCFCAGVIFIMIGISRLVRSAQEGARGPGGLGTVTTFVVGGVLISATTFMRAASATFFGDYEVNTEATLQFAAGMSPLETAAVYNVISAVLKFMIIVGLISFVRGIFIMRDVSEGSQQASAMSGITHIVGGALAVNLGPLLNAVQNTLGINAFGVTFG